MSFKSQNEWEGINFPSESKDWKTIERNNPKIAFNALLVENKTDLHLKT